MNILWLGSLTFTMKKLAIQHGCHLRQPYWLTTHFWRFGKFRAFSFEILIEMKLFTIGQLPVKILTWLKSRFYSKYAPKVGDNRWFLLKNDPIYPNIYRRINNVWRADSESEVGFQFWPIRAMQLASDWSKLSVAISLIIKGSRLIFGG